MVKRNKQPYLVVISPQAKEDINHILSYLQLNWSQKIIDEFLKKVEAFYLTISIHPQVFGFYNKRRNIRKFALTKKM